MPNYRPKDHTFVLCAYGESPHLSDCANSLLSQTIKTNVIISTSTPNDHIRSTAAKLDIPLYVNDGEPSISHDWNCAIGHCDTPLVTIAHQDDLYLPKFAECVLDSVNQSSFPLISFTDYGEVRDGQNCDNSKLLRIKRILLSPLKVRGAQSSRFMRRRILSLGSSICCPAVTFCLPNLPSPLFRNEMKCDLDWDAWERFSKLEGDFVYIPKLLMRHRIHEGSETTALIEDNTRGLEDLQMLKRFWPGPIAKMVNWAYGSSQKSNSL